MTFPLVILDDDPTGVQASAGVPIVLDCSAETTLSLLEAGHRAIHVMTNSRAVSGSQAGELVRELGSKIAEKCPQASFILRGDSTLRGHLWEEYLGLAEAIGETAPPLLLVPALPAVGRLTRGGIHFVELESGLTPVAESDFAKDGPFAYRSSRLVEWAEERSADGFNAGEAIEIDLAALRRPGGHEKVADALAVLARLGRPAVCVPDAETTDDLKIIAAGLELAEKRGVKAVVRSSPAFASVFSGALSEDFVAMPKAAKTLVVCGSYIEASTRQLEHVGQHYPGVIVELDLERVAAGNLEAEAARLATECERLLTNGSLAVIATPRGRKAAHESLEFGERVVEVLAAAVRVMKNRPSVVITKGGITSAVVIRDGVPATWAEVVGPVAHGIAHWFVANDEGGMSCIVVPGNVIRPEVLTTTIEEVIKC